MGRYPQTRVDVRVMDLGSELMVCDDRKRLVHVLNSTARRIWDLCDGTHRVEEIADEVSRLFPEVDKDRIRRDVETVLRGLDDNGIIVWVTEPVRQVDEGSGIP